MRRTVRNSRHDGARFASSFFEQVAFMTTDWIQIISDIGLLADLVPGCFANRSKHTKPANGSEGWRLPALTRLLPMVEPS
jgi:hypothetical protein